MKEYTFGFIGCGNMGGALARAVAKTVSCECILLCDASVQKADALAGEIGAERVSAEGIVQSADTCSRRRSKPILLSNEAG